MKSILTYAFLAAYVLWTLVSCTAFTAPKDPVTGIRKDAPPEWQGTPDPLDTPETFVVRPPAMGRFGPHSEYYNNL